MCACPQVSALGIVTDEVGRGGKALQVLRAERRLLVRGRQLGVGVPPSLPAEGPPTPNQLLGRSHLVLLPRIATDTKGTVALELS